MKITSIEVDTDIYPLAAVQAAAYIFIQDNFIRIEKGKKSNIVIVKSKSSGRNFEDGFFNELLHQTLRLRISENSRSIRDRIVIQALSSASQNASKKDSQSKPAAEDMEADVVLEQEIEKLLKEAEEGSYKTDPLKISVPWEETDNSKSGNDVGDSK